MTLLPDDVDGELRRALGAGALLVVYQPLVDLHDATLGGVEALVRWRHPSGVLPAGAFLPEVRDGELRAAISDFVHQEASAQASTWRRRFEDWRFPVSVNVDACEFDEGLVDRLARLRAAHDLPPGALALDISEPVVLDGAGRHLELVRSLKRTGAQIVVDDFGTTHTAPCGGVPAPERTAEELMLSLAALEEFPVDVLKIDRELVDRCFSGERGAQVMQGVVKLAHLLGCRVLAEGVETGEEAERLRRGGFDLGQGYYFQRPHGPGHIDRLLHDLADARAAFAGASAGHRT